MSFEDEDRPRPRIWETTRQRRAEAEFWPSTDPHLYERCNIHEPAAEPLADLHLPAPSPAPNAEPKPELHELSVQLTSSDGLVLSNVELVATDSSGAETSFATNTEGLARTKLADDVYHIRFAQSPVQLPPVPAWSKDGGWGLRVPRDCQGFSVAAGSRRDVVVVRPAVTEVLLDGWAQGSCVMRWGGMRQRVDGTVGTARGALRIALWLGRGKTMAVAGHADSLGQDSDNDALSKERAKSVQLFASGQLEAWADHAASHASQLDVSCAMVACSKIWEPAVAGLNEKSKLSAEEWLTVAELYANDLCSILLVDRAGLSEIQSTISWTNEPTLALGERFPRPESELADLASPLAVALRRCSLLVFGPDDTPQAAVDAGGHELYDGTYYRTVVPVPGEVLVDIAVDTTKRDSIARGRAWINVGTLGAGEHTAEEDGHIRFVTLRGDRVEVIAAFDADGNGTMVSGGVG